MDQMHDEQTARAIALHAALRASLDLHYKEFADQVASFFLVAEDRAPVIDAMDQDYARSFALLVAAIRRAEELIGRRLPDGAPEWVPELLDRWDEFYGEDG